MATTIERLVAWALRASWVAVGVSIAAVLDELDPSDPVGFDIVRIISAVAWVVGAAATTFPAVRTLTAVRVLVPSAVPVTVVGWIGGAEATSAALALGASMVASAAAASAEFGRGSVQASAYGAEDRHVLRAPPAYLAAAVVSWLATTGAMVVAGTLLAAGRPVWGGVAGVTGTAMAIWSAPRWHRLSRRWLVVVPAGLVVHDHLVLAETLMITRAELSGVALARADTSAADLTGPAGGHALEITTHTPVTAILAPTPERPGGRAIHLTAALVAPSRPGRALAAATRRRPAQPATS